MGKGFARGVVLGAVVSTVVLIAATALAGAGIGAVFNLGQLNTVNASTRLRGTVTHSMLSVTNQDTATGLAGNETQRTWNGTGDGQVSHSRHSDNGETRTYDMTYDTQVQNVVVPFPRTADSWPLSGSIARHVVVKIVGGPHDGETRDRTTVVTFNGTELVPIQVNGKTYTLDLKTRRIVHDG